MIEERGRGREWGTGPLEPPLGRGVNFQVIVDDLVPLLDALATDGWPLFMPPEKKWYRVGAIEIQAHQFLVQDPDGYLVRFSCGGDRRPVVTDPT